MYLVVFRNRKCAGIDTAAYDRQADRMEQLAREQPGFLAFKSFTSDDGEAVALSEWQDEQSARRWGRQAEHLVAQAKGRESWYDEYTLYACDDPQIRKFVSARPD
ncbi:antibiotic biosynthesis monooxygenase [Erythrobacter alti]|uniref:antibiotic biosynthesis monooxygenase family protein n=1 Tax=Erythrobacter alti TaxID=1896145 RepID=UPI0030F3E820